MKGSCYERKLAKFLLKNEMPSADPTSAVPFRSSGVLGL